MKNKTYRYLALLLFLVIMVIAVASCGGGAPAPTGPKPTSNPQHQLKGFENCLNCHKTGPGTVIPADHAGRTNSDCTKCHTVK